MMWVAVNLVGTLVYGFLLGGFARSKAVPGFNPAWVIVIAIANLGPWALAMLAWPPPASVSVVGSALGLCGNVAMFALGLLVAERVRWKCSAGRVRTGPYLRGAAPRREDGAE